MFQWARERARVPFNELLGKFPKLGEWESGERQPTLRQLEDFASTTMAPLGYFFLPQPPEEPLPIPDFRTIADNEIARPSPNLLDTLYSMQRRQAWLHGERQEHGHEPLAFIGSTTIQANPDTVAVAIREVLGFDLGWAELFGTWTDALAALRDRIEEAGVIVVINGVVGNNNHRKLDPQEFRGFVLVDDVAPLIFVNGADAKAAQMFTLVHELAHLWIAQDALVDLQNLMPADSVIERFCNRVAAQFLVPGELLLQYWNEIAAKQNKFQMVARKFKVSEIVAARRALDMGLIQQTQFFEFYDEYIAKEKTKNKSSGGDFYLTQNNRISRAFGRAIVHAVREGRLLYRDAYALTGLQGATFDKFAAKIAGSEL